MLDAEKNVIFQIIRNEERGLNPGGVLTQSGSTSPHELCDT